LLGGDKRGLRITAGVLGAGVSLWILTEGTAQERKIAALALAVGIAFGLGQRLAQRFKGRTC
jgi:hypothetical protein